MRHAKKQRSSRQGFRNGGGLIGGLLLTAHCTIKSAMPGNLWRRALKALRIVTYIGAANSRDQSYLLDTTFSTEAT